MERNKKPYTAGNGNESSIEDTLWGWWYGPIGVNVRSILALPGIVFFWTGLWDALDLYVAPQLPRFDWAKEIAFVGGGVFLMLLTKTFFSNAGLERMPAFGLKSPDQSDDLMDDDDAIRDTTQSESSSFASTEKRASIAWMIFLYIQALISIIGSTVYWTGAFNLLNLYVLPRTPIANCICSAAGLFVFIIVRAIVGSHVAVAEKWQVAGVCRKLALYACGGVALSASVLFWTGLCNLLTLFTPPSLQRELVYLCIGIGLFAITNTPLADLDDQTPAQQFASDAARRAAAAVAALRAADEEEERLHNSSMHRRGPFVVRSWQSRPTQSDPSDPTTLTPHETTSCTHRYLFYPRTAVTMIAAVLVWTALEDIIDNYLWVSTSLARQLALISIGFCLMFATNAVIGSSGVITPLYLTRASDVDTSEATQQAKVNAIITAAYQYAPLGGAVPSADEEHGHGGDEYSH